MQEFQTSLVSLLTFSFVSMFSMVNPIGMAPVFLEKTAGLPAAARHALAYKVAINGTILLVITMLVGPYVLQFFGLTLGDIQVAGGIFVFYAAWQMLTAASSPSVENRTPAEPVAPGDIAFFPLTMPLTAGAGSIAISLSLSSKIIHSGDDLTATYAGAAAGICLVFLLVAICYRFADTIFVRIGPAATAVITRLTAFLLLAIGVSVTWGGLKALILTLHA